MTTVVWDTVFPTATPIPTPTPTTGTALLDIVAFFIAISFVAILVGGGILLAINIKERIDRRIAEQDEEVRDQLSRMRRSRAQSVEFRVWNPDNDSTRQPSRRERNVAETRDEGRAGVCTECGQVRRVQKCYDAVGKMSRLCNDCLYTGKQELKDREEVYAYMFGNWDL